MWKIRMSADWQVAGNDENLELTEITKWQQTEISTDYIKLRNKSKKGQLIIQLKKGCYV